MNHTHAFGNSLNCTQIKCYSKRITVNVSSMGKVLSSIMETLKQNNLVEWELNLATPNVFIWWLHFSVLWKQINLHDWLNFRLKVFLIDMRGRVLLIPTKNIYGHLHILLLNGMTPEDIALAFCIQAYLWSRSLNFQSVDCGQEFR